MTPERKVKSLLASYQELSYRSQEEAIKWLEQEQGKLNELELTLLQKELQDLNIPI